MYILLAWSSLFFPAPDVTFVVTGRLATPETLVMGAASTDCGSYQSRAGIDPNYLPGSVLYGRRVVVVDKTNSDPHFADMYFNNPPTPGTKFDANYVIDNGNLCGVGQQQYFKIVL